MTLQKQNTQTLMDKVQSLPMDRITELENFVDFLRERAMARRPGSIGEGPLNFPVDNLGPWPEGLSLRREELYGHDER